MNLSLSTTAMSDPQDDADRVCIRPPTRFADADPPSDPRKASCKVTGRPIKCAIARRLSGHSASTQTGSAFANPPGRSDTGTTQEEASPTHED